MELNDTVQQLKEKFAAPLPEYYMRRIIFWKDESREFEESIKDVSIDNVKIISLTGSNYFEVKKLLLSDDTSSSYLIYDPLCKKNEENWLLDIEQYSEIFHADRTSIWISEMGLPQTLEMHKCVKSYKTFFNSQERRFKLAALGGTIDSPGKLHLAVMTVICGLKKIDPADIMQAVLCGEMNNQTNKIYADLKKYGADVAFWDMVSRSTGYSEDDESSVEGLAKHILLTAASVTLKPVLLKGLCDIASENQQTYCYSFVSDWINSKDQSKFKEIAQHIEELTSLPERLKNTEMEDIQEIECFPCIDDCLLSKLMTEINDDIIDLDRISKILEKRRIMTWYGDFEKYYEGVLQIAKMHTFKKEHDSFNTVDPVEIWNKYAESYYLMDKYYRLFHLHFNRSLKSENSELSDLFKQLADKAEGLYSRWFLGQLGEIWSKACEEQLKNYGRLINVPYQGNFYKKWVEGKNYRVFVIISDALRYGTAVDLEETLSKKQSEVTLHNCQAVFPTITKFGMAALLPHKELSLSFEKGVLSVMADKQSTDSPNRENILKKADPESIALKYDDIIKMKKAERVEKVKGKNVVYIYHDKIDSVSHSKGSVFEACDEAVKEISNLIRIIVNEMSGTRILITADHGFIYTYEDLDESDKVNKSFTEEECIEYGRRYAILKNTSEPENLMEVKLLDGKTDYRAFAPRENIRIKMRGSDGNFVHGGTSLQEMMVPVIEYKHLRNDSSDVRKDPGKYKTEYVSVSLHSIVRSITNKIFSLIFYQKEAVKDNIIEARYSIFLTDEEGERVTDIQKIFADKKDEDPNNRTFKLRFTLISRKYLPTEKYYLVIENKETGAVQKEEFQINLPFDVDDFNF